MAFRALQDSFNRPSQLAYFNSTRTLYINVDASKERRFSVVIYYIKSNLDVAAGTRIKRTDIKLLLFISKILLLAEINYQLTELETVYLVQAIRKVHYQVKLAKKIIIQIDYTATPSIAKQTILSSSNIDKLNIRLVRASQYLLYYDLDIRWKPRKQYIILDALSRLLVSSVTSYINILDDPINTPVYNTTVV